MRVYKLTEYDNRTYAGCLWGPNVKNEASGLGDLCSPGWLHFYYFAELAIILNPIHSEFSTGCKLWEADAQGYTRNDSYLKGGCAELTTIREIPKPVISHSLVDNLTARILAACFYSPVRYPDFTEFISRFIEDGVRPTQPLSFDFGGTCYYYVPERGTEIYPLYSPDSARAIVKGVHSGNIDIRKVLDDIFDLRYVPAKDCKSRYLDTAPSTF